MFFALIAVLIPLLSWSHQSSLTTGGNELFWANPAVPVAIRTNTIDMNADTVKSVIQNSMAQWNSASSAKVNAVASSNNEIKFVSNFPYGSGVIGITEISYNNSGAISKAVISLNDDYYFHSSPGLYPTGQVFLGDVVTHELGHLFGLSHSEVLDSSMFYASFSGQSTIASDDKTGVRQKYDLASYGRITGVVRGGNRVGVLGAHVQAISRKTGKATAVVTDENGNFELGGLDVDDTYYLYTAPIKNSGSLPGYFSNVQDEFCPAAYVGSFFSKCGKEYEGKPQGISLTSSLSDVDVGTVTINCGLKSNETYNLQKLQSTFSPVTIYTYDPADPDHVEQGFVGWFRNPSTSSWSGADIFKANYSALNQPNTYAKVSLISFPLGTQLEYEITIVNGTGATLVNGVRSLVLSGSTDTYSTDYEAYLPLNSAGGIGNNFEIRIKSRKLSTTVAAATFPSQATFSSSSYLPYLVVVSLWQDNGLNVEPVVTEAVLSDNDSCLDAPFTYAVAKTREVSNDSNVTADQAATAAGCGTIEPPKNGPGSSLPLMAAGFFLVYLASTLLKSRKKFLS